MSPGQEDLIKLVTTKMPFGKYENTLICDLPVAYLEWFARKGFPKGKLGTLLSLALTLKSNGDQEILNGLKAMVNKASS